MDDDDDGVIDSGSIGSPGTAKNVIAVGASENNRNGDYACDSTLVQPSDNTCTAPGDTVNAAGSLADDADQMADFSSRGPTDDGRIKPDVVAPGTWVLSGYSDMYQISPNPQNDLPQWNGWGVPPDSVHKYMGGTSMSNPLVAGAAAVVRDYYQKAYGHAASAALVKATLINTAVDMADEDNVPGTPDIGIPNIHEGWGRVDLDGATAGNAYVDDGTGLVKDASASFAFSVATAGLPFKVSLVWSDFPSTASATQNLVNDLDLVVTDGTTTYRGNDFIDGWSQAGGSADRVNNVENVYIQSAAAGTWSVEVRGYNVPNGPQPFALVVDGGTTGGGNQAPSISAQSFSVDENSPDGTVVGTVVASDPDVGDSLTFAITAGNTGTAFAIASGTGQLTVANSAALDFETTQSFALTVEVTDTGSLSAEATMTVNLNDVVEGSNNPPSISAQSFSVDENSPDGTVVGTVVASDPDVGDSLTFAITAGNTGTAFAIASGTGQLTVANSAALDFETTQSFALTVEVTDTGSLSASATVTVNLNDVAEGGISLSATLQGRVNKKTGEQKIRLEWSGATGTNVDVKRDGAVIATTANDGTYTDSVTSGTYAYQVCEAGTANCSKSESVAF